MRKHKFFARALYAVMALALVAVMVPATPVSAIVSGVTVTNVPETIGTAATYTIGFTTTADLADDVGTITIIFPDNTTVPDATTPYNGKVKVNGTVCGTDNVTGTSATWTVEITVPKTILGGGAVEVVIDKAAVVKNPTTVKDTWKLSVNTSAEAELVYSASYSTVAPVPPTLTVGITEPADGSNVSVGDTFNVTAVVINTGPVATTNSTTKATIEITGDATKTSGDSPQGIANLPIGGSAEVKWTVTCDGVGAVTIEVTPAGEYDAAGTPTAIPGANLVSDTIGLTQQEAAALEVTDVTAPSTVKVGEEFTVTATVNNTGEATAKDVALTIDPGAKAALTGADETLETKTKLQVPGLAEIASGASVDVSWAVKCTAVGDAVITVTPAGTDANTEGAITDITPKEATVIQTEAAVLEVKTLTAQLTTPRAVVDEVIGYGNGYSKAFDFTLAKSPVVASPAIKSVNYAWNDITGDVSPMDLAAGTGTVTFTEAPKDGQPILATYDALGPITVGDEITVTATVNNTGEATAKDVALTLAIDANAELKTGEVATQTVGYLNLTGTSTKTWTLVCTAAGTSTITVTPSGTDVLTGLAIPAGSLIAADVTVLQSVTTSDITLCDGWNLISLPLIPTDPTIHMVLADLIDADTVSEVRTFESDLSEKWYIPGAPASTLSQIVDGRGYWIESTGDTLTITGVDFALPGELPTTYDVVPGWNLIGFTSTSEKSLVTYLGAVKDTIQAIYGYDASTGAYFIPEVAAAPHNILEVGHGYWLAVSEAGTIYP